MSKADLKALVDDASAAMNDLGFFMGRMTIDVRNVAREIQAYDNVELAEMEAAGKAFKEKTDKAYKAYRALYAAARKRYGKDAA